MSDSVAMLLESFGDALTGTLATAAGRSSAPTRSPAAPDRTAARAARRVADGSMVGCGSRHNGTDVRPRATLSYSQSLWAATNSHRMQHSVLKVCPRRAASGVYNWWCTLSFEHRGGAGAREHSKVCNTVESARIDSSSRAQPTRQPCQSRTPAFYGASAAHISASARFSVRAY